MRLIDADELEELFNTQIKNGATDAFDAFDDALQDARTVDAVPVVRCKDCEYAKFNVRCSRYWCGKHAGVLTYSNDFCSYGEREEATNDR